MPLLSNGAIGAMLSYPGLASALTGDSDAQLRLYAGAAPSSANAGVGAAVLLCTIEQDGTGLQLDMDGQVLTKPSGETWSGTNVASGTATFFRLLKSSDSDGTDADAVRLQGNVARLDADLNLTDTLLVESAPQDIKEFIVSFV